MQIYIYIYIYIYKMSPSESIKELKIDSILWTLPQE